MRQGFWRRMKQGGPVVLDATDAYAQWAPAYPPHAHNRLMELERRNPNPARNSRVPKGVRSTLP